MKLFNTNSRILRFASMICLILAISNTRIKHHKAGIAVEYDKNEAYKLIIELGKLILDSPDKDVEYNKAVEWNQIFNLCMQNFHTDKAEYTDALKRFYLRSFDELHKIETGIWNPNLYTSIILNKIANDMIQLNENVEVKCIDKLQIKPDLPMQKILNLYSYTFRSHQIKKNTSSERFITSLYSVHRNLLPHDSFKNLNYISRFTIPNSTE